MSFLKHIPQRLIASRLLPLLLAAGLLAAPPLMGQAAAPTRPASPATAQPAAPAALLPPVKGSFTERELSRRPYSATLPNPLYPSTPRVQKQFTVEYLFNYAQSTYTPPAALPLISTAAANRDTPEGAVTAFYSAMAAGDYQAWLLCWDKGTRVQLEARTKTLAKGVETWREGWRAFFAGHRFLLVTRLETVGYVVLDARIEDLAHPAASRIEQETLVYEEGSWYLTNRFMTDGLMMNLEPNGPAKVSRDSTLYPADKLTGPLALTGDAQKAFLTHEHTTDHYTQTR